MQLLWHACGLVVVPTVVTEGMTVVPADVVMQVFWQACNWLVQPKLQVRELALWVGNMVDVGAVVAWVPAVDWSMACACAGKAPASHDNAMNDNAMNDDAMNDDATNDNAKDVRAAGRIRPEPPWRRGTTDIVISSTLDLAHRNDASRVGERQGSSPSFGRPHR